MISTHVLDTSLGTPAKGIVVELERQSGSQWTRIAREETNADGRIAFASCPHEAGTYRLSFEIEPYFKRNGLAAFFPSATVVFHITDTGRKYHVPLLLNPYGYSTYRGS